MKRKFWKVVCQVFGHKFKSVYGTKYQECRCGVFRAPFVSAADLRDTPDRAVSAVESLL